ncbi:MAG: folate-binding protein YgfZ [Rhizobacter sp.]|nr:folate-binding protein YgfZ [Rhizobacter sp.]MBP6270518.1 folate-binding protein YgfZ [Rhizobacter sp.]
MTEPLNRSLAVPLTHWGVIRAHGADAAKFLHGQLTQDVLQLGRSQARIAGYCSAKGRLLASFVLWKTSDDEVLLACHTSVLAATLKRLSMFVMRAQCKLTDATDEISLQGLTGDRAAGGTEGLPAWGKRDDAQGAWIRLPDVDGLARAWRVTSAASALAADPVALRAWQQLEIDSGIVTIEAATVDQFVPQMLNFELIGAVNFQKGCYPGQEVVARSQYRGTAKRRTFLFSCDEPIAAGQEVFHSADPEQPAGMVAGAVQSVDARSYRALVEVKLAALACGSLHLGAVDGALLTPRPLPYEVPVAEAA